MSVRIRAAEVADFEQLQRIEVEAGRAFADVGLASVAADPPFSDEELEAARRAGRLWVAVADAGGGDDGPGDDAAVGYVLAREVGGRGHVEQVSVLPDHQGRGIGRLLVERVASWARAGGHDQLTLSTFRDVAWNAPLYAHLGFRTMGEAELDDALRAERAHEAEHGLDVTARVFMIRPL